MWLAFLARTLPPATPPEAIAEQFYRSTYARDSSAAWELVSAADQATRSKPLFLADQDPPTGTQAALYRQLAAWVEFQVLAVASNQPGQAIVTATVRFPDLEQPAVADLLDRATSPGANLQGLSDELERLRGQGALNYHEGDIGLNLVSEQGNWRVLRHWGHAVSVQLAAVVSPGLPWEFYPVERQLLAVPGELVHAEYVAHNLSDQTVTGMALHQVGPAELERYFQTIQCFCFSEQTLAPGEQREMELVFRIDGSLPREAVVFQNRYSFYTLDEFPGGD